ncbi:MAG: hypothetical protein WA854_01505 [Candidatus Binataceae bacterium]
MARNLDPVKARVLEFFHEQSDRVPSRLDDHHPARERRGGRGWPQFQIAHRIWQEFSGDADAAADLMSRLIWEDASYHDGVVVVPEGGIPEAQAIASISVIFDR